MSDYHARVRTVPMGPSIVPTHSKRFASDFGNADYERHDAISVKWTFSRVYEVGLTIPGDADIWSARDEK